MKSILSFFFTSHADSVGNSYRINRLKFLSERFRLSIITNVPNYLEDKIPNGRLLPVNINYRNTLEVSDLKKIKHLVKSTPHDLIYYFHNDARANRYSSAPRLCEIHQSHEVINMSSGSSFQFFAKSLYREIKIQSLIRSILKSDYFFAVSKQLTDFFITKGVDKDVISYLPHGVNKLLFNTNMQVVHSSLRNISNETFVMVYTGWISENRGLSMMLNGLKSLVNLNKDVHLVLVGCTSEDLKLISKFSKDYNVNNNITLLGRIDQTEIPSIIYRADICLSFLQYNKSYALSPPQKIFEYFSMGKPVLANKLPTHSDYITNLYNGILIEDLNESSFLNAVLELLNNKQLLADMSSNSTNYAKHYDLNEVMSVFYKKVEELIN